MTAPIKQPLALRRSNSLPPQQEVTSKDIDDLNRQLDNFNASSGNGFLQRNYGPPISDPSDNEEDLSSYSSSRNDTSENTQGTDRAVKINRFAARKESSKFSENSISNVSFRTSSYASSASSARAYNNRHVEDLDTLYNQFEKTKILEESLSSEKHKQAFASYISSEPPPSSKAIVSFLKSLYEKEDKQCLLKMLESSSVKESKNGLIKLFNLIKLANNLSQGNLSTSDLAALCNLAYHKVEGSTNLFAKDEARTNLNGLFKDLGINHVEAKYFFKDGFCVLRVHNKETNEVAYAIKGSSTLGDFLQTDTKVALGLNVDSAIDAVDNIIKEDLNNLFNCAQNQNGFPSKKQCPKIYITGHSLGAGLANEIAYKNKEALLLRPDDKIVGFESYVRSNWDTYKEDLEQNYSSINITNVVSKGSLVSNTKGALPGNIGNKLEENHIGKVIVLNHEKEIPFLEENGVKGSHKIKILDQKRLHEYMIKYPYQLNLKD